MTTKAILPLVKSNILIVGSGAIGLLWYSYFHLRTSAQSNVYLYQSSNRKTLPSTINFTDLQKKSHYIPSQTYGINNKKPHTSIDKHSFDIVLICVKSYQLNTAIEEIRPLLSTNTIVITSHNGLGALSKENSKLLAQHHLWNLLTTHGCLKSSENTITHTGEGISDLGTQCGKPSTELIQKTTTLLHLALPDVNWCNQLAEKQWTKLAINCVINPLTALFDIKNGEIADSMFDNTINQLLKEIIEVAQKNGVKLSKTLLKETVINVANTTANNSSSMRCDIQAKRTTEIEYINGYIHQMGEEANISTKKNTELYQGVLALHFNNVQ